MPSWPVFLPTALLMAMVPGANQVLGLRNAALLGIRPALAGVAGRFSAFGVLVLLVVIGLGAVLSRSAVIFEMIRWAGVVYLIWLGLSTLWRAGRTESGIVDPPNDSPQWGTFRREFVTALTNPKAILLFASFLPQFLPRSPSTVALIVVAAAYIAVEAIAAVVYLGTGLALRHRGGKLRIKAQRLDHVVGVSFLGFGCYLATTHPALVALLPLGMARHQV